MGFKARSTDRYLGFNVVRDDPKHIHTILRQQAADQAVARAKREAETDAGLDRPDDPDPRA